MYRTRPHFLGRMEKNRYTARLFTRSYPRFGGCAPLLVLVLVASAVVMSGRHWIGQRLNLNRVPQAAADLPAAFAAFDNGDLDKAVEYAGQVIEREGPAAAYELLVRALIYRSYSEIDRASDRESALRVSREAVQEFPRSHDLQAVLSYALQANGSADEAGRVARRIVERLPRQALARIALSLSYGARGMAQAALREANIGLDLAREQRRYLFESYRAAALAYSDLGNYREALAHMDQAIRHSRRLIPLHFEAALFALQVSDIDRATVSYFRIMALDEDNVKVRVRLCELSDRLLERESALRYCREVTELAPNWSDGWYKLGRLLFLAGDYINAQSALGRCSGLQVAGQVDIAERRLECWYLQGQSAEVRGDCAGLMAIYREFLDMVEQAQLPQTWSYPPGGPPICAQAAVTAQAAAAP